MSRISERPAIHMPSLEEDEAIRAAAMSDPDALPLTTEQLKAMVPLNSLRGRPRSAYKKVLLSVRYSPEVVAYFKATGDGWQSRMDSVLREYVEHHSKAGSTSLHEEHRAYGSNDPESAGISGGVEQMDDEQLNRSLQSIGMACFVKYFRHFNDTGLSNAQLVDLLIRDERYTESGSRTRVGQARRIIRNQRAREALRIVEHATRIADEVRRDAGRLADALGSTC